MSLVKKEEGAMSESRVNNMTLESLRSGQTQFSCFVPEGRANSAFFSKFSPYVDQGNHPLYIRGTRDEILPAIAEIFPELYDSRFFVAEAGRISQRGQEKGEFLPDSSGKKIIVEFCGENRRLQQWTIPSVSEMSTKQIISVWDLLSSLDKDRDGYSYYLRIGNLEFGYQASQFEEEALAELFSRSEKVHFNYRLSREITWLMWNFRKENHWAIEWLRTVANRYSSEESFQLLCGYYNNSPAVDFLRSQAMTGNREEWGWLPAVPKDRLRVWINTETLTAFLPTGECFSVQKIPVEGGYFRIREDSRADLFLSRGSSKTGPVGWLWVLVNPRTKYSFYAIEAGIDPLDNYNALSGVNGFHTPLFNRISRAHAKARGWNVSAAMYSDAVEMGIKGPPEPAYVPRGPFADVEQYFLDAERREQEEGE